MRSPAHHDRAEILGESAALDSLVDIERRSIEKKPIDAPFGWAGAFLLAITIVIAIGLLQDRDARIERQARIEDATRSRAIQQLLDTCPRTETDARTIVAFFNVRDGQIAFDHCVALRARSSYSPATRTLMADTQ